MAETKILIIEDDYYVRELYEHVLTNAGFGVLSAENGEKGYEMASMKPSLILLDIMLPGNDGISVLKQLKANEVTKDIPVIILTNLGNQTTIKEALENGAAEYLLKPEVDPYELADRIQEYLEVNPPAKA